MNPIFYARLERILERRKELLLRLSEKEIILPTAEEIVEINKVIMQEHKGIFGIRDVNLLESAIGAIVNKMEYEEEKNLTALGSILFARIIKNHPFIDGNKRTAVVSLEMFLEQNARTLDLSNDRLYTLAVKVARGDMGEEEVAQELKSPSRHYPGFRVKP